VSDYYRMSDFLVTRHENRLFITLRIPITMSSSRYDFYRVEKFPVRVPDNQNMSTVLTDTTFGLGVPVHMPIGYMVFQNSEQATFRHGILDLTESDITITPYSYKHCIMALFRDDIINVKNLCTFAVVRSQPQPMVIHLLHNRVLLNHVQSFDLVCGTESRLNVTACKLCEYTIPCGCALSTPQAIVPATISSCVPHVDNTTVLHGFNLIVLQQFFASEQLGSLLGSTLTKMEIEADLPSFKTYEHNEQERLATDGKLACDLSKLSNLTKQDNTAFHSLAEFIHSDLDQVQDNITFESYGDYKTWQFWLLVCCTMTATAALLASLSLWFKFRLLAPMVVALRSLPTTSAHIPTHLSYFTTASTTLTGSNGGVGAPCPPLPSWAYFDMFMSWVIISGVIVALLIVCIVVIVFKRHHKQRSNWTFCLNIGNENENVIIPIQNFPNHPYCYTVTAETFITSLKVEGWIRPTLKIDWPSISVVYWPNLTKMKTKSIVHLSLVDVVAVKRILTNQFWCIPVGMMCDRLTFLAVEKLKSTKTGHDVYATTNVVAQSSSYPSAPLVEQSNTLYPDLSTEMTVN